MKYFVVSGISRGLGNCLHEKLGAAEFQADQKIFLSRTPYSGVRMAGAQYVTIDFTNSEFDNISRNISNQARTVIFINNAGVIEPIGLANSVKMKDLERVFRVNCSAPLKVAQDLALATKERGASLLIINISSGAASRPIKGWLAYCVSKASAKMAFDVLSSENAHVQVIDFDPGVMDTDMQKIIREQREESMPDVKLFRSYEAEAKLKSVSSVAQDIIRMIGEFCK